MEVTMKQYERDGIRPKAGDRQVIRFLMDRLHVSTSDADIEADIRARAARSDMVGPTGYVDALVDYALKIHHENQQTYRDVMGGHLR
jgi:hypothetical protein